MTELEPQVFAQLFIARIQSAYEEIKTIEADFVKYSNDRYYELEQKLRQKEHALRRNYSLVWHFASKMEPIKSALVLKGEEYTNNYLKYVEIDQISEEKILELKARIEEITNFPDEESRNRLLREIETVIISLKEIIPLREQIQEIKTKHSTGDFENEKRLKNERLTLLQRNIDSLIKMISLPIYARYIGASDKEIEEERQRLIDNKKKEIKKIAEAITVLEKQEDPESKKEINLLVTNSDNLKAEIRRIESLSTNDLRNELATKGQEAFLKEINWGEVNPQRGSFLIENPANDARQLYNQVATYGVDPRNIVFATIAQDSKLVNEILPLADKYKSLKGERVKAGIVKFDPYYLYNAFCESFNSVPKYNGIESRHRSILSRQFFSWLGYNESDRIYENTTAEEIKAFLTAKIAEVKRINAEFEAKYPPFTYSFLTQDPNNQKPSLNLDFLKALEEMKPYISESDYDDLKTKFENLQILKNKPFLRIRKKVRKEIAVEEEELIKSSTKVSEAFKTRVHEEKKIALMDEYIRREGNVKPGKPTPPKELSAIIDDIAENLENFASKINTKIEEMEEESQRKVAEIDASIKGIIEEVKLKTGIRELPEEPFPAPTNPRGVKSSGSTYDAYGRIMPNPDKFYTAEDVARAYDQYYIEGEIGKIIAKAKEKPLVNSESPEMGSK